jgi:hypothetical protein
VSLSLSLAFPVLARQTATRKPRLSLRFVAWFLLRFAARRFCAPLIQQPPRCFMVLVVVVIGAGQQRA